MRNTQLKVVIADSNLQERESKQLSMEARGMKVILSTGDGNKVLKVINDGKADIRGYGYGSVRGRRNRNFRGKP
ncbi:MAG: hypothetical protein ACLTAS_02760 [Butyribacter sp.]